jgi:hypothetical protein
MEGGFSSGKGRGETGERAQYKDESPILIQDRE